MTLQRVIDSVVRNKVLILGLLMSVVSGVAAGEPLIVILGAALSWLQRQLAVPVEEVDADIATAFNDGVASGVVAGTRVGVQLGARGVVAGSDSDPGS